MSEMIHKEPVRIFCRYCGSPAGFDILHQTYRCPHCGRESGIQETKNDVLHWRKLQKQNSMKPEENEQFEECTCPSCGAHVIFPKGEVSVTCDFCGSKLVHDSFTDEGQMPDLIIPFFITKEEARKRMLDWGHQHENTPEGKSIVSNMGNFKGYYLPYYLVHGPVYGTVSREGTDRTYHCAGYLNGTAVNTSGQLDNMVLNEMEPYDWSEARPFSYGYIAGQRVKLCDISDAQLDQRIREKTASDFQPEVKKVLQTASVNIRTETGNMNMISALLPVYLIKSGKLTAVMNGQTGRIAVSKERKKTSRPWMAEPLIYTIAATLLSGSFYHFKPEPLFLFGFVFACIFFGIMGDGRHSLIQRITLRTQTAKAERENGTLKIREERDILKNPFDNTPVFFEPDGNGNDVPVKIRFYGFGRWFKAALMIFMTVSMPAIIAAVLRLAEMNEGETFMAGYRPEYGAAWYVTAGFFSLIYLVKGMRREVYEHPLVYEILPDGKLHLINSQKGTQKTKKQKKQKKQKKEGIFSVISDLGGIGKFLAGTLLLIFFVSIAAIIS